MLRKLALSLFTLIQVFVAVPAFAQQDAPLAANIGRAPFALTSPTFNCPAFLKSMRRVKVWHIAFLYNTFGNDFDCYDKIVANEKTATIEYNLINEPGHRNKRLGNYEFLYGIGSPADYDALLRAEDKELRQKFSKYVEPLQKKIAELPSQIQCLVNPGLESNLSDAAGRVLIKWTNEEFGTRCRTVWNPMNASKSFAGADLMEAHGPIPPVKTACLVNLDGTDIDFPTRKTFAEHGNFVASGRPLMQYVNTYASNCEVVFLWTVEDNCSYTAGFKDPRKRNCSQAGKVAPLVGREVEIAQKSVRVFTQYPWTDAEKESLKGCSTVRSTIDGAKRNFLLKQSEFRDRGGVILLPRDVRGNKVQVSNKGKVVDTYSFAGIYDHDGSKRPMFRSLNTPVAYPFHSVIRVQTSNGLLCYKSENPRARND